MYCVYLIRCTNDSLYCGITNNLKSRLETHNAGRGAKYTATRLPVTLVCAVGNYSKGEALRLEWFVKQRPKSQKETYLLSQIDATHPRVYAV